MRRVEGGDGEGSSGAGGHVGRGPRPESSVFWELKCGQRCLTMALKRPVCLAIPSA